jgi:hypothetical protein
MTTTYVPAMCACLGPQCGNPHCPCVMLARGLPQRICVHPDYRHEYEGDTGYVILSDEECGEYDE